MSRVLVTGGGSGIGLAMAEAFMAAGHRVWVMDVDAEAVAAGSAEGTVGNAANEADVARVVAHLDAEWGGIDVVCANAGTAGPTNAIDEVDLQAWKDCVSVNLEGAFLVSKHAAPILKRQGAGAIIYTSSTAGIYGYPNRAPYAAAKWGIIGLMKTAAMELGPYGVRANAICPGAVEGPRMEGVLQREATAKGMSRDQVYEGYAAGTSMRRFVQADEIAQMAVFLGSDAAQSVSGQVIAVDGHTENPDPKP